ncbi:MAG: hypothetical protein IPK82_02570 [Polyangiaceae bacterium]|nr:hypothetical protein [Polyangiaceae bacterium]
MARRKTLDPEPSLFPFLSVLAAVMGTLVLIISGMSKIALASPKQKIEVETFHPEKKAPIYVECREDELRIYGDDPSSGFAESVPRANMVLGSSAWQRLVQRLQRDSSHYILFLIRENGITTFESARTDVAGTNIEVGYEPLFGTGDVLFHNRKLR